MANITHLEWWVVYSSQGLPTTTTHTPDPPTATPTLHPLLQVASSTAAGGIIHLSSFFL